MRLALVALTVACAQLSAQSQEGTVPRRGYFTGGGVGLARADLPCTDCTQTGMLANIAARVGFGITNTWAIVADGNFAYGDDARAGGVFLSSKHHWSRRRGPFARAGAGVLFGLRPSGTVAPFQVRSPAAVVAIGFDGLIGEMSVYEISLDWARAVADGTISQPGTNPISPQSRPSLVSLVARLQLVGAHNKGN